MKTALLLLTFFAPLTLQAQVTLVSLSGIVETPIGASYNYGAVAVGDSVDQRFHARNNGTAPITVTNLRVTNIMGSGFGIVNTSSTPVTVASGNVMAIFIRFSGNTVGNYSAALQVTYRDSAQQTSSVSVTLLATAVPAPTLTMATPCTGPDATGTVNFGRSQQFVKVSCPASVQNPGTQPILVSLGASSSPNGFTASFGTSVMVAGGQIGSFVFTFNAPAALVYSAPLTVGPRNFTLAGVGFFAPLPAPLWTFDSANFASAEQHTLSLALSGPAPVNASGSLNMAFASAVASITDDRAVQFVATSKRVASFTVKAGDTAVLLNGQPNIVFATGTTAGRITFTIDPGIFGIAGDPSTGISLALSPIVITAAAPTRIVNDLQVDVTGFDNSYTAGPMSFSFFDRSGGALGGAIAGNFSSDFRAFFQNQTSGSAFRMRLIFPVTGDVTQVGGVEVTINNAAGTARTQRLNFP